MLCARTVKALTASVVGLVAWAVPQGAAQGAVMYGNFIGPDVTYTNVTESDTQLPGPTPPELFGPPSLAGDTLQFTPDAFSVSASGGSNEFQDGHLSMVISPNPGAFLPTISITEGGAWAVGGGTAATTALESLVINDLFITSVNGTSVNPIAVAPTITYTYTNDGSAGVVTTPDSIEFTSTSGFSTGAWDGTATFNLGAALTAAGFRGAATSLSLNLDNQLAVTSETNSDAFIDKKFFDIGAPGAGSPPIPEPATTVGMAVAGFGLLMRRRSRRA